MSTVTVKFAGFWPSFDIENNKFVDALRARHRVQVLAADSSETPDLLFYSRCGTRTEDLDYDCIKIYFTGENDCPDFNRCDYAISFYPLQLGERHLRYPLFMLYEYERLGTRSIGQDEAFGRPFCSLVLRNADNCDPRRLSLIDTVESYRPLAYGGRFRNNVGGCVDDKIEFIAGYKFNLALENSDVSGYVTEKLLEPLIARTVPIYWGNEAAKGDFNPEAFINVNDYDSADSLLNALRAIDTDPGLYARYLCAPPLRADAGIDFDSRLADFLDNIVTGRRRHLVSYGEQHTLAMQSATLAKVMRRPRLLRLLGRFLP